MLQTYKLTNKNQKSVKTKFGWINSCPIHNKKMSLTDKKILNQKSPFFYFGQFVCQGFQVEKWHAQISRGHRESGRSIGTSLQRHEAGSVLESRTGSAHCRIQRDLARNNSHARHIWRIAGEKNFRRSNFFGDSVNDVMMIMWIFETALILQCHICIL